MEIRLKDGRIVGGLEISDEPQQFNKDKRKYERMNETLRDMITMRVYRILRKKGVPLLEPYEFTLDDKVLNNSNTNGLVKDLLFRFKERYSKEISDALLNEVESLLNLIRKR